MTLSTEALVELHAEIGPSRQLERLPQMDLVLPPRCHGHVSFSQLRSYINCPACYGIKYTEGSPRTTKSVFVLGNMLHGALELARLERKRGNDTPPIGVLEDAAAEGYQASIEGRYRDGGKPNEPPVYQFTKEEQADGFEKVLGKVKDKGISIVRATVPPTLKAEKNLQVVGMECPIRFDGVFPFPFIAYADAFLRDEDDWEVEGILKDTKSVPRANLPDEWCAWQTGIERLPWHYATENLTVGIDQYVKTKDPKVYLWTEEGYTMPYEPRRLESLRRAVIDLVEQISHDYQRGYFVPHPASNIEHDFPHDTPTYYYVLDGAKEVA